MGLRIVSGRRLLQIVSALGIVVFAGSGSLPARAAAAAEPAARNRATDRVDAGGCVEKVGSAFLRRLDVYVDKKLVHQSSGDGLDYNQICWSTSHAEVKRKKKHKIEVRVVTTSSSPSLFAHDADAQISRGAVYSDTVYFPRKNKALKSGSKLKYKVKWSTS